MEKKSIENYIAPSLEVIEVEVEKGYIESNTGTGENGGMEE